MKIYRTALVPMIIVLLCTGIQVRGQNGAEQRLKAYMDAQATYNHFSGTVLVARQGSILFEQAYGNADREHKISNTLDTKYNLSSITKMFTAVCILQLAEQGRLSLQDTLSKFFAGFPRGGRITLHMMLNHSSGLSLDFDTLYMHYTASVPLTSDSVLHYIEKQELLFEPGTGSAYSNTAYYLLARIIEKVSGRSYSSYLKEHIFDKAGMSATGIMNNREIIPGKARNYFRNETGGMEPAPYINWDFNIGHDGIYSTAGDLYRFDQALYGSLLLSTQSKIWMTTRDQNGKGYGCMLFKWHGHEMMAHGGGFWGAASTLDRYTRDSLTVIMLSNNASELISMDYGLSAIAFDIPVAAPYPRKEIQLSESRLEPLAGSYGNRKFVIVREKGRLWLQSTGEELVPESATRFFVRGNPNRAFDFNLDGKDRAGTLNYWRGGVAEAFNRDKD